MALNSNELFLNKNKFLFGKIIRFLDLGENLEIEFLDFLR